MIMLFVFLVTLIAQVVGEIDINVVTKNGPVRGQRVDNYSTFFGIPYAKVDERNPFGASLPTPKYNSSHPFQANDSSIICAQTSRGELEGHLDCLNLNIYVPDTASTTHPVPILVWFHGGRFEVESGSMYGGKYLVKHNIIVVTVNYRLGPYGFLCLNDPLVPGNQGLKDQISALRWIRDNIKAFGGNPEAVTIAGESAGGGSVDLHLYSNYETLFNKVIIQSGSSFVEGMFVQADHDGAKKIAKEMGYEPVSSRDALRFLVESGPGKVLDAYKLSGLELRPCQEIIYKHVDSFVTDDPYHMKSERIKEIAILTGYNSKEEFGRYINKTEEYFEANQNHFYDYIVKLYNIDSYELEKIADSVKRFYMGSKKISKETVLPYIDFSADFMMNRASEKSVTTYLSQGAKRVYKYLFSYIGGSPYKHFEGCGASHMEELKYLFELEREPLHTDEEIGMRDRMTTMWANFVKYGEPIPQPTTLLPVKWLPMTGTSRPYLNIDVKMSMADSVYNERVEFWELYDEVYWRHSKLIRRRKVL